MDNLQELRKQINDIDEKMGKLFNQRMEISGKVACYKKQHNLPVLDESREAQVIAENLAKQQDEQLAPYYAAYLREVMAISRGWQAKLLGENTVAFQGTVGGFGHAVAQTLYPIEDLLEIPTFSGVFEAVESGQAAFGIVPFENSNTGDVSGVLDLCYQHSCFIYKMVDLPVQQNLLALPGAQLSDIKKVYSHPQGLAQCMRFIQSLGAAPLEYANTALAAKFVAESGDVTLGAIGSLAAGKAYGLQVIASDISTESFNTTRFIVISKQQLAAGDRFSLLVTIENTVGSLERVIGTISSLGLNMENIKSRPMPKRPWEYYFYIELLGSPDANATQQMLQTIGQVCVSVRMLGCYSKIILPA